MFCILIGTVNVACNAVGTIEFVRAFFLSGFLFGSVVNVGLVLASWRLLPIHVVARQISAVLRSAANKVDELTPAGDQRSSRGAEPPASA